MIIRYDQHGNPIIRLDKTDRKYINRVLTLSANLAKHDERWAALRDDTRDLLHSLDDNGVIQGVD